tara:strand:- start:2263 stop:2793 length:531 start_codon:yes stop_codon:yes gene_type:complete
MIKKNYKTYLNKIKTFIFDVDGVLTDGKVLITSEGEVYRAFDTKDGFALKCALMQGFKIAIITGGNNEGIKQRFKEFGICDIYMGSLNKIDAYKDFMNNYSLKPEEILYVGDDIPDIPVMKKVGISCCPSDAVPDVKEIVDYVSHKKGGEGCVREIIEQVLRVQDKWKFILSSKFD